MKNKKWFTLIELMVAITIFFIMSTYTYVNYTYYQNITQVKLSLKDISQSINDAKNMAINWYQVWWKNQSIWLYLSWGSNELYYYAYDFSWAILNYLDSSKIVKTKKLQNNVFIKDISGNNNAMIYFNSIYWTPELYYFNPAKNIITSWSLKIDISFKDAVNPPLKRSLEYTKSTNRIDY